jgi:Fe-S-cluster containining protein
MRDALRLRVVKHLARWSYALDLRASRARALVRGDRPWTLVGHCQRSSHCCEAPAIAVGGLTWSWPLLRRLFLGWQRRVNGFELVDADPDARAFVFRCTHFDRGARSCDSYDSRPAVCRDYPRNLMWQANPELLPGCGYRAAPPNAAGLRAALDRLALTPQQREKLQRGLRLDG